MRSGALDGHFRVFAWADLADQFSPRYGAGFWAKLWT